MSSTNVRRRLAIASVAIALTLSWGAAPASAFTPPAGAKCANLAAGYIGFGTQASSYHWDGRLKWQICIAKTGAARYGKVQLSSPVSIDVYDRFTGLVNVYLEGCYGSGHLAYSTLTQASRGVSGYDVGPPSGGRYYFPSIQTPSTTTTATSGYRVHIQTWVAAVVARSVLAQILALSSKGMATGQGTDGNFYTGCMLL
jgi:hypothetical protein